MVKFPLTNSLFVPDQHTAKPQRHTLAHQAIGKCQPKRYIRHQQGKQLQNAVKYQRVGQGHPSREDAISS